MSTKSIALLKNITIFACLKLACAQIPKPNTVFVPVPFDLLENIRWTSNPDHATSTCGTFKPYIGEIQKVAGRWYTMYMTKIPSTTNYCSHFSNVQTPCSCIGIDFSTAMKESAISFVAFSSNRQQNAATYEMMTATMNGKSQLNLIDIVMRGFVARPRAKLTGIGGYIIPNGVIVDSDNFEKYMIIVFCKEGAIKPIVMVLVNALPMDDDTANIAFKYLRENNLDENLMQVDHDGCNYAQNIVIIRQDV